MPDDKQVGSPNQSFMYLEPARESYDEAAASAQALLDALNKAHASLGKPMETVTPYRAPKTPQEKRALQTLIGGEWKANPPTEYEPMTPKKTGQSLQSISLRPAEGGHIAVHTLGDGSMEEHSIPEGGLHEHLDKYLGRT